MGWPVRGPRIYDARNPADRFWAAAELSHDTFLRGWEVATLYEAAELAEEGKLPKAMDVARQVAHIGNRRRAFNEDYHVLGGALQRLMEWFKTPQAARYVAQANGTAAAPTIIKGNKKAYIPAEKAVFQEVTP